jgi:hypothetical protein
MAFWEDTVGGVLGGGLGTGLVVGGAALVLGPWLIPAVGAVVRPLAKTAIKGGMYLYGQAATMAEEVRQEGAQVVSEARAEVIAERTAARRRPETVSGVIRPEHSSAGAE